jgi:integrase
MLTENELVELYREMRFLESLGGDWIIKCFTVRCLLGICALRVDELAHIRIGDFNRKHNPPTVFVQHPKGGEERQRFAQVTPEFNKRIRKWLHGKDQHDWLFPNPYGRRNHIHNRTLRGYWEEVMHVCGIPHLGTHDGGRNTVISWEIHRGKWSPDKCMDLTQVCFCAGAVLSTIQVHYLQDVPGRRYRTDEPKWIKEALL